MIVVATPNGMIGIKESIKILKEGGSAIDAVEAGIRLVESNPKDHTVGYSGFPNILGEVELDAGIMDGKELIVGAVGAIKGFEHPISIARKVMEYLPHVFLVGRGAEHFASQMGFNKSDLLTEEVKKAWELRLKAELPEIDLTNLHEVPELWKLTALATDPEKTAQWMAQKAPNEPVVKKLYDDLKEMWMIKGTVNFLAQDTEGNICAGTSTSGWAGKYPGRIGDSPIIGAGLYADNRYGAAACTGMGEMAIRAGTARSALLYMKMGATLEEAGQKAINDLKDLGGRYLSRMNIVMMDKDGNPAAFSNDESQKYIYMTENMKEPKIDLRTYLPNKKRWEKLN